MDEQWWPNRKDWPDFPAEDLGKGSRLEQWRNGANEALALLILDDVVIPLNGGKDNGIVVQVICNDVFYWACADSEPIPPIGFGADMDQPFWDLYDRYRKDGWDGVITWCCLRRGMRPQTPMEERMRASGSWSDELENLPVRDPKDCG